MDRLRLKECRVLLVGAGGIGCELLKNLVKSGFGEVHIVDLDTIDLSNLNRQFLFRKEHVKKYKAEVAKESASKFSRSAKLEAYSKDIKDPQFSVSWFSQFVIVFNALDNLDARRHVNRMCLMANVPLIESGTTGFDGQVQVIKKSKSECYDCTPKPVQRSFPICTIRSTPSQPIHCIVWAKSYLLPELFGASEDSTELDSSEDAETADEIKKLHEESLALKKIRQSMGSNSFPKLIFEKVFKQDIERLQNMEDMWKTRKRPETLDYDEIYEDAATIDPKVSQNDQHTWSLAENLVVFSDSIRRLSRRYKDMEKDLAGSSMPPTISFDKDDTDTLDFVSAAANFRALVFNINPKAKFDIKQMAGNIIPAIATTNAMVAGLCVMQAFHVLNNEWHKIKMIYLERSTARIINTEPLRAPNPDCTICSSAQANVVADSARATLKDLVDDVLKPELGYTDELSIRNDTGVLYDPDFEDNLPKKFNDLGIKSNSILTVVDEEDDAPHVNLSLSVTEKSLPEDSKPIVLPTKVEVARKARLTNGTTVHSSMEKRKRTLSPVTKAIDKKRAIGNGNGNDVVIIDDTHEGAIFLD